MCTRVRDVSIRQQQLCCRQGPGFGLHHAPASGVRGGSDTPPMNPMYTMQPSTAKQSRPFSKYGAPTQSKMTSTPLPCTGPQLLEEGLIA